MRINARLRANGAGGTCFLALRTELMGTSPSPEPLPNRDAYLAALHRLEELYPEEPGTEAALEAARIKAQLWEYETEHWEELRSISRTPPSTEQYDHGIFG